MEKSLAHKTTKVGTVDVFLCDCGDVQIKKVVEEEKGLPPPPSIPEKLDEKTEKKEVEKKIEEEKEPVDWATVGAVSVIALIFLSSLFVVGWVIVAHNKAVYSRECKANPTLLYANQCVNAEDCLVKCIQSLKNKG